MSKGLKRALLVVGVVVGTLMAIAFAVRWSNQPAAGSVLEMVLNDDIPEYVPFDGLSQLFGGRVGNRLPAAR